MGVLTDIVIADDREAASVVAAAVPSRQWQGMDAKGIDQVKLSTLWALLADREFSVESVEEFATLAEESEDGPWVFRVPRPLLDLLAQLDTEQAHAKARAWAATEEFTLDRWKGEDVERILDELRALAREAAAQNKSLLMWMSL